MASSPQTQPSLKRLPLSSSSPRRLSFELRTKVWLAALAIPLLVFAALFTNFQTHSLPVDATVVLCVAAGWALTVSFFFETIMRPLQTLSNVVAALREDDFSFRARGARRGDALGDLALEINALAATLQSQRSSARDALSLAEQVMSAMQSPVLAFDSQACLHLLNPAAERTFNLRRRQALGKAASELRLDKLLSTPDLGLFEPGLPDPADPLAAQPQSRWSIRRTAFRLHGVPHTLFVLADVSAALREEERLAWQRLIRVLGHEINNSLTPIKSIAGSLRSRLPPPATEHSQQDFARGLSVIEDRADSLNRFLQAYQQLWRLPPPSRRATDLAVLVGQVARLEIRLDVIVHPGPELCIFVDPDQMQQMLINIIRNAADSALAASAAGHRMPEVGMRWREQGENVLLEIDDNGTGLLSTANLFVPFYTTKPAGTGVGLILAQQIANAHDGSIRLANRTGSSGCRAEILLPARPMLSSSQDKPRA